MSALVEHLARLTTRREGPPRVGARFEPVLPADEDALDSPVVVPESTDQSGLTFAIEYEDAAGQHSLRRITVKSSTGEHLNCFCHERRARRTFRIDRIISIVDIATGELIEDVDEYLEELDLPRGKPPAGRPRIRPPGHKRAMARVRDGARILMWFARVDGYVHPSEIEVVLGYCRRRCDDLRAENAFDDYDASAMEKWVIRQYPDFVTVRECARRLHATGSARHTRFLTEMIASLVEADGVVTSEEFDAGLEYSALVASFDRLAGEMPHSM